MSLVALVGITMMIGGGLGALAQGTGNSTVNLEDTCKQIASANNRLNQIEKTYQDMLSSDAEQEMAINTYNEQVGSHLHNTKFLLQSLKQNFKQQELANLISLSVFIFILILSLLLKKFKVYDNIWNYFVK